MVVLLLSLRTDSTSGRYAPQLKFIPIPQSNSWLRPCCICVCWLQPRAPQKQLNSIRNRGVVRDEDSGGPTNHNCIRIGAQIPQREGSLSDDILGHTRGRHTQTYSPRGSTWRCNYRAVGRVESSTYCQDPLVHLWYCTFRGRWLARSLSVPFVPEM